MLTFNSGKKNEVAVRVFIESEPFGREYFDEYESLDDCAAAVARLTGTCIREAEIDGVARQIGIAVVPRSEYGSEDGYGYEIGPN
jgi:hypothetical protein